MINIQTNTEGIVIEKLREMQKLEMIGEWKSKCEMRRDSRVET